MYYIAVRKTDGHLKFYFDERTGEMLDKPDLIYALIAAGTTFRTAQGDKLELDDVIDFVGKKYWILPNTEMAGILFAQSHYEI